MAGEASFIELMRAVATDPAARGLIDDAAVLQIGGEALILTHDMMIEDVHWLPTADPSDVAWKLLAVNLSDLAAKGAQPLGILLGFTLGDDEWDRGFAAGLDAALRYHNVALLGGDTVGGAGNKRSIGMTALGRATHQPVPSRGDAQVGDILYVTGHLGDARAGFELITAGLSEPESLLAAFNRPQALLADGQALAPVVHAMMDVSDGLLLDASRMADASALCVTIDIDRVPVSDDYIRIYGDTLDSRISAASWGDDYQLLFAAAEHDPLPVAATAIGKFSVGAGLKLNAGATPIDLPAQLGYEHR